LAKIEYQTFVEWRRVIPEIHGEVVEAVGAFDDVFAPVVAASKLTATKYPSVVLYGQGDEKHPCDVPGSA
jgi:hypothetical protein